MKDNITGGATLWARQTIDSEIFFDKPDKWFKIWFFIVNEVSHQDNGRYKRGERYFRYEWIMERTKATKAQVHHCLRFLRKNLMIATHKKTHGLFIEVLNYNTYQRLDTYKRHTERQTEDKQKTNRRHNINKNDKNVKNVNTMSQLFSKDCLEYKIASYLEKKIIENNPVFKPRTESQLQKWCVVIDRLIRLDNAKTKDIKTIIDWVYQDEFWSSNIMSAKKLREHYPKLWKKAVDDNNSRGGLSLQEKINQDRRLD
jgi:hypothetical protein